MYGLVNKAVESLVLSKFGQDTWDIICEKANISGTIISMKSYDDQVTYDLVGLVLRSWRCRLKMYSTRLVSIGC